MNENISLNIFLNNLCAIPDNNTGSGNQLVVESNSGCIPDSRSMTVNIDNDQSEESAGSPMFGISSQNSNSSLNSIINNLENSLLNVQNHVDIDHNYVSELVSPINSDRDINEPEGYANGPSSSHGLLVESSVSHSELYPESDQEQYLDELEISYPLSDHFETEEIHGNQPTSTLFLQPIIIPSEYSELAASGIQSPPHPPVSISSNISTFIPTVRKSKKKAQIKSKAKGFKQPKKEKVKKTKRNGKPHDFPDYSRKVFRKVSDRKISKNSLKAKNIPKNRKRLQLATVDLDIDNPANLPDLVKRRLRYDKTFLGLQIDSIKYPGIELDRIKQLYTEVELLLPITGQLANEDRTNQLIRPCYSKVISGELTKKEWLESDIFLNFYLKKTNKRKVTEDRLSGIAERETQFGGEDAISPPIFCIHSHTTNDQGSMEYFLLQYWCKPSTAYLRENNKSITDYLHLGEVSWQPGDNIPGNDQVFNDYKRNWKTSPKLKVFTESRAKGKETQGRINNCLNLPDLGKPLSATIGDSCNYLENTLENMDIITYNPESNEFKSVLSMISFYENLSQEFNKINKLTRMTMLEQIVGKLAYNNLQHIKLNKMAKASGLKSVINPNTAKTRITDRLNAKKNGIKNLVIAVLFSFNDKCGTKGEMLHCQTVLFEKCQDGLYRCFHFEPSKEDYTYWNYSPTLKKILSCMNIEKMKNMKIYRAFERQTKENDCFLRMARYAALINDNYDFENLQNFVSDKILFGEKHG